MRSWLGVRTGPWPGLARLGLAAPGPAVAACVGAILAGLLAGALAVGGIGQAARDEVARWLVLAVHHPDGPEAALRRALLLHGATFGLLWLGGATQAGLFLVPSVLVFRSFSLGFTVAFLTYEGGWPGLGVVLGSVAPSYLVALPAWLVLGAGSLADAWRISAARLARRPTGAGDVVGRLVVRLPAALSATVAVSALDAYLAPAALRALVRALGI
ncbi:MAG: stage II sporulation protein M [Clostridia bacterium]|nr:stage II sporulation protein M [Clostridia bacterium]